MAATSRTALFNRVHKVLRKQSYRVVVPDPNRPLLEHLLFAACLENAQYGAAEEAYAALEHGFFGWNEIRVSTVRELAEVMAGLPDPARSASNFKRLLHSVFELRYAFELEDLRKMNLAPAVEIIRKLDGSNNFSVAYVIQAALAGHAIPVDDGASEVFHSLGLASEEDVKNQETPGLDRAIAKSKGVEFGSLLHQFSTDFMANRFGADMQRILLEMNPDAADNLPRRRRAKKTEEEAATKDTSTKTPKKSAAKRRTKDGAESVKESTKESVKESVKESAERKKSTPQKASSKRAKSEAKPSGASAGKRKASGEKPADTKKKATGKSAAKKKADSSGLSKKKPR